MKAKINIDTLLTENGFSYGQSPWDFLLEEAKTQEVNSDDESPGQDDSSNSASDEASDESPKLSDDDLQQLIQQLQQSPDAEKDIKKLLDDGSINQADVENIGKGLEGEDQSPEEEQQNQINNIQEMVIRFSIYDKLNNLENKLRLFTENFPNVDEDFYKNVSQIHDYIKIVNTLIFNLEINLVYQLYANLEMKLISIFTEYQNKMKLNKEG